MENPLQFERVNPLLKRIQMPGETFALPSGGIFYKNGELDDSVKNAEVRVHPMTAVDEICLRTPDMVFSGDAVRQVFGRCIPQVLKPDDLLAKDVDYLLVCLRKVSYGPELQLQYTHDCKDAKEHTYTVDVTQFIQKVKRIDPTKVSKDFSLPLPNDQIVALHPLTYGAFINVLQSTSRIDQEIDIEKLRDFMVDSLADVVAQVDEISDPKLIREWLVQIPPSFIRLINKQIGNTLQWGTDFNTKEKCLDCGKEFDLSAPMNPLIFFS